MKSNYMASKSEQRRVLIQVAKDEITKQKAELCPNCQKNTVYQVLATVFWILHRDYGYGATRLKRLKDDIESEFNLMELGVLGQAYTANHIVQHLKDQYGIDFEESIFKTEK